MPQIAVYYPDRAYSTIIKMMEELGWKGSVNKFIYSMSIEGATLQVKKQNEGN